jgi:predicted ATP-dependent serine protease
MTTFQKPQALKAALKMALYGPAGSGKTFTALLVAEGLTKHTGKRVAYVDTEYGTAFYGQHVPERGVHPQAFEYDALYTKSITDVLSAVKALDHATHGVLVIDSISHLWDACKNAFTGRLTKVGSIPAITEALLRMVDAIRRMLATIENVGNDGEAQDKDLIDLLNRLAARENNGPSYCNGHTRATAVTTRMKTLDTLDRSRSC